MSPKTRGCYISSFVAVVLVFLAVILTVAVGVIVYFAVDGRDVVCQCQTSQDGDYNSSSTLETFTQQCQRLALEGHPEICTTCSTIVWDGKNITTRQTTTPTLVTEPSPAAQVTNLRLPKAWKPSHYDVEIQPFMHFQNEEDFYFKGKVRILMQCRVATDNVTLHASPTLHVLLSTVKVFSFDPDDEDPSATNLEKDEQRQFLIIKLDRQVQVGKFYGVEMSFDSRLSKDLRGLYYGSYTEGHKIIHYASTQFAAADARKAFPCLDEPALKATFNITLIRPRNLTSLSNMPVIDSSRSWNEDGVNYVADVYQQTPQMSTYLLAFIICDFDYLSTTTHRGIEFRTWSKREAKNLTSLPLRIGVDGLAFYETIFEQPYQTPKIDMIAIPSFKYAAMENWGLITYREIYMFYTPGVTTEQTKEHIVFVVCHELSHQWLGNLVTPAWWDHIWVSEGFTSFTEYLATDHLFPHWKVFERRFMTEQQLTMKVDSRQKSHPIQFSVLNPQKSRALFDMITYKKGASLVRMMKHFIGADTFRRGMVNYFRTHAYGAVTNEDLLDVLTEQVKMEGKSIDVKAVMATWLSQMNFPLVTVSRDIRHLDVVHVRQERYLSNRSDPDLGIYESPYGYRWTIPITLVSSRSPRFNLTDQDVLWLWHNESGKNIHVGMDVLPEAGDQDGWILANINQTGFYRVNYHLSNWKALTNQLKKDHEVIPVVNRANLISDAWALFKSGDVPLTTALMTLEYLYRETDYLPWFLAKRALYDTRAVLLFSPTFGPFQRFLRNMSKKAYETFGLDNTNSSHADTLTRALVTEWACGVGNLKCLHDAYLLYRQWMDNPSSNPIDRNTRRFVYCAAVRKGGWEEWKFALQMYDEATSKAEKFYLLMAMACSEKPWILNTLLHMLQVTDSPIPQHNLYRVLSSVARNNVGRPLAWNFFKAHLTKFLSREKNFDTYVLGTFSETFYTEYELRELTSLVEGEKQVDGTVRGHFDKAIARTGRNVDWMRTNEPIINKWLKDAGY